MTAYRSISSSYDRLTEDVDYQRIFHYLHEIFHRRGLSPRSLLDLGCGTASVSLLFASSGVSVTALDISEEMLTQASMKAASLPLRNRPRFLCCPMQRLSLPQPVDCAISSLDSMNYVTCPADLRETLSRVYDALNPGGVFAFDFITPSRFRSLDGQIFLDEDDDVYCVWRADFDEASRLMTYGMDLFQRSGNCWKRSWEAHEEYAYEPCEIETWLKSAGFSRVSQYGNLSFDAPNPGEQRVWFVAEKE